MKKTLRVVHQSLASAGIDPRKILLSARGFTAFWRDYRRFVRQEHALGAEFQRGPFFPCLGDRYFEVGTTRGHYFHQDFLVARRIFERTPERHVDVGSRIDGFVTHVACYRTLEVIDIRPLEDPITNVSFIQADLMAELSQDLVGHCDSLSCLHALEHFGLGRFGDPVSYDGHRQGLKNLTRLLRTGGTLYLSVPIGPQQVQFNAHRIFSVSYMLTLLKTDFELQTLSYVDDEGALHENVEASDADLENSFGCSYGCGIFEMIKC